MTARSTQTQVREQRTRLKTLVESDYVGVRQAATMLGVSRDSVYAMTRSGVLSSAEHAGKLVIPVAAITHYKTQRLRVGTLS